MDYQRIYCLGNSGNFVEGWLSGATALQGIQPLTLSSLSTVDLEPDGITDYTFKTRREANLYDGNGNFMLTVPAGYMITTNDAAAGASNRYWMSVNSYGLSGPG